MGTGTSGPFYSLETLRSNPSRLPSALLSVSLLPRLGLDTMDVAEGTENRGNRAFYRLMIVCVLLASDASPTSSLLRRDTPLYRTDFIRST